MKLFGNKGLLFTIIAVFSTIACVAQNQDAGSGNDSLCSLYRKINTIKTDAGRRQANDVFYQKLSTMPANQLFSLPFDSLKLTISVTESPDKTFRIFNWAIYYNAKAQYEFYGFIIVNQANEYVLYPLSDKSAQMKSPEDQTVTNKDWYGALYYEIIPSGNEEDRYYVLLGWDGNDLFTNRKVIDVLWFDENYVPNFGKPVLQFSQEDIRQRVVFEFAETSTMKLRYEPKLKMIIFDHLVPSKPEFEGKYEYYGSDFTFDGLKFEDGKWTLNENVDLRNGKSKNKKAKKKHKKS